MPTQGQVAAIHGIKPAGAAGSAQPRKFETVKRAGNRTPSPASTKPATRPAQTRADILAQPQQAQVAATASSDLLTPEDAAAIAARTVQDVQRWAAKKALPVIALSQPRPRQNMTFRVKSSDLTAFLQRGGVALDMPAQNNALGWQIRNFVTVLQNAASEQIPNDVTGQAMATIDWRESDRKQTSFDKRLTVSSAMRSAMNQAVQITNLGGHDAENACHDAAARYHNLAELYIAALLQSSATNVLQKPSSDGTMDNRSRFNQIYGSPNDFAAVTSAAIALARKQDVLCIGKSYAARLDTADAGREPTTLYVDYHLPVTSLGFDDVADRLVGVAF